ncbi:hypothetical protein BV25DRAFT_1862778 [Artomyces pyxidatus]|uniref:Uncharacterized protein n=1 Tax=Artomyces pyxidatus TaxID=48021 RepID=A0ACB8SMS7_9AGAM|nr:hypothetical protein BV25DRAFT_1862778 [Artomyces pyxidatus]
MPFGLTMGTERASALQNAIAAELMKRGYSPDADPVMAEYIIIMIINNKTQDLISSELEDLIGPEFERSFTDWLFEEAKKGAPASELSQTQSSDTHSSPPPASTSVRDPPPHLPNDTAPRRQPPNGPRSGAPLYQQALSQAIPSTSTAQKRTASARSPSPTGQGPSKTRRTDVPVGPRAMLREGRHNAPAAPRSLLERVGGPAGPRSGNAGQSGFSRNDDIQARIDNITGPDMNMQAALAAGFVPPNMNGMDMNAMAAAQMGGNPLLLQEMMMNQMAMMAQMATSLGMLNPVNGQFMNGGSGFPMQGGMQDMGMYGGGFQGPQMNNGGQGRGRGGRGGYSGRGRGGRPSSPRMVSTDSASIEELSTPPTTQESVPSSTSTPAPVIVAPTPARPEPARPAFAVPDRPQSPTLCKFALKCTNAHCRWSHPSPVATPESGVVLSNEACEQGKNCKDKDCIKAHVSPAAANPELAVEQPKAHAPPPVPTPSAHVPVNCRYGASCTRRDCQFQHPPSHRSGHAPHSQPTQPCRFGAACTRASCPFQHPEGRVLPSTFHRGLTNSSPMVSVSAPATGSMGAPSPHRSVVFNTAKPSAEALEQKVRAVEDEKNRVAQAVKEAEEAAGKKDDAAQGAVAITV